METRFVRTAIWNTFRTIPSHMLQHLERRVDTENPGSYYTDFTVSEMSSKLLEAEWTESVDAHALSNLRDGCRLFYSFLPGRSRASHVSEVPSDTVFVVRRKGETISCEAYHHELSEGKPERLTYLIIGPVMDSARDYMDITGVRHSVNKKLEHRSTSFWNTPVVYTFHPGQILPSGISESESRTYGVHMDKRTEEDDSQFDIGLTIEELIAFFPGINYCVWCGEGEHLMFSDRKEEE